MQKEIRKLKGLVNKLASSSNSKYEKAVDVVVDYFSDCDYDIVLLLEDYLVPLLERLDAGKKQELGVLLYNLPDDLSDSDYEYLQNEYGWEVIQLINKAGAYCIRKIGALLYFISDAGMFGYALYEELKYHV